MPNNLNAAKRQRQNVSRRLRNRTVKSSCKTAIKAFEVALKDNNKEVAEEKFKLSVKMLDSAAGKGIFHKNTVARKKSRMSAALAGINA
ncbi:30S ribosomal protein S20 [Thiospirochaeta perfilievii]|uniref:Small ribosomal subunit protein bS20 n=1 Tax=Thiospirochaeta perfilievii TaxID=252967 RepID=A0A5C1Q9X1_9SPIO|nr:30S ribosomal protein S20 [Thiospirochaeta perfilievii]QEN03596.1 30S ribosomal protein S20 [Thiospirochaeta perfilievii]